MRVKLKSGRDQRKFIERIEELSGENVFACYQCGRCSAGCPMASEMDLLSRTVARAGRPIDLLPREFQILEFLMRHSGQVVTRTMLLEQVWNYHFDPKTGVIDVQISRLRQKLDKGYDRPMLQTVRGAGYCLRAPD